MASRQETVDFMLDRMAPAEGPWFLINGELPMPKPRKN